MKFVRKTYSKLRRKKHPADDKKITQLATKNVQNRAEKMTRLPPKNDQNRDKKMNRLTQKSGQNRDKKNTQLATKNVPNYHPKSHQNVFRKCLKWWSKRTKSCRKMREAVVTKRYNPCQNQHRNDQKQMQNHCRNK